MLAEKIMKVADLKSVIDLPWDETQEIEVFVFPLNPKKNKNTTDLESIKSVQDSLSKKITPQSMKGILSEYAKTFLIRTLTS